MTAAVWYASLSVLMRVSWCIQYKMSCASPSTVSGTRIAIANTFCREHENSAREQREESVRREAMHDFLRSLRGFISRDDSGIGDDDRSWHDIARLSGLE